MGGAKIVVSGGIGAGKSTVVRAAMKQLGWTAPGGFFTHWDGAERGAERLYFEPWTGGQHLLARRRAEPAEVGGLPYELEGTDFPVIAVASWAEAAAGRPVVIDELGLIEFGAPEFPEAVARLFRGPAPVLAVVQERALGRWLEAIGRDAVTHRLEVAAATRAALPAQIAALFRA